MALNTSAIPRIKNYSKNANKRDISALLGFAALCIDLILVYVAASRTDDTLNIFLIGAVLNIPRFLFVGVAIGYLHKRLYGQA